MLTKEKLEHHVKHLQEMHDDLDQQIQEDYVKFKDDALILVLKKKKLHLKDEIEKFKEQIKKL